MGCACGLYMQRVRVCVSCEQTFMIAMAAAGAVG